MTTQRDMLATCRDQFAMYAQSHRAKVGPWREQLARADDPTDTKNFMSPEARELHVERIADTIRKAEENERLCREVQAVLDQPNADVLMATAEFPIIVYDEGISEKNQQTQLGVHFEEVDEMIGTLHGIDIRTSELLGNAHLALSHLGHYLKDNEPGLIRIADRVEFLDAICDQLVTATVGAVLYGMDPVAGLAEVNRSNYSKLIGGRMEKAPVTQKWVKGPNYSPPDLTPFV